MEETQRLFLSDLDLVLTECIAIKALAAAECKVKRLSALLLQIWLRQDVIRSQAAYTFAAAWLECIRADQVALVLSALNAVGCFAWAVAEHPVWSQQLQLVSTVRASKCRHVHSCLVLCTHAWARLGRRAKRLATALQAAATRSPSCNSCGTLWLTSAGCSTSPLRC